MGLLDSLFDQNTYGGQGGGLLDMIRQSQQQSSQYQPSAGFGQPEQAPPMNIGGYQMPRMGDAAQFAPPPQDPAALPQNAQPAQGMLPQARPQETGFGDRLMAGFQGFANAGGPLQALAGGIQGLATGNTQQSQTAQYLASKGIDPAMAQTIASDPQLLRTILPQLMGGGAGTVINNRLVEPRTGRVIADFSDTKAPETKEFETAGGGKTAMQWDAASKSWKKVDGVGSGGAGKPPANYKWIDDSDPSKGVAAIPGGPGTHIPAETAGRIAMMETAAADLPKARETLMNGRNVTGTTIPNMAGSALNTGEYARANRTVTLAIEGALRAMTGAAAPETEVRRYKDLFMPSALDSRETATQKLNQLDDFISNASRLVKQGRGPAGNASPGRASDPFGIR